MIGRKHWPVACLVFGLLVLTGLGLGSPRLVPGLLIAVGCALVVVQIVSGYGLTRGGSAVARADDPWSFWVGTICSGGVMIGIGVVAGMVLSSGR